MKNQKILAVFSFLIFLWSCQKVPITGRTQIHGLPESELESMSLTQYNQVLKENKVITGTAEANLVNTVGKRISDAAQQLMTEMKYADRVKDFHWEYHLLESKEVNAWCMPGGKIAVYSGLLPVTQTEAALAAVIGHEVGHALAQHGNERMSQQLIAQGLGAGLSLALANKPAETQNIYNTAFAVGAQYGALLPFSRTQESEADKIGLVLMAKAGYDPHEAIGLWERMKQMSGGGKAPEFMSTHPSDDRRIADIKKYMPEALKYYKK
ncbi:MAG: M48 family metallopeptidase [Chitinophagales bacterium]|nr:M48 family metallopeptidase [Chitinophagales bacterium]